MKGLTVSLNPSDVIPSGEMTHLFLFLLSFLCRSAGAPLCCIFTPGPRLREQPLSGGLLIATGEGKRAWQIPCSDLTRFAGSRELNRACMCAQSFSPIQLFGIPWYPLPIHVPSVYLRMCPYSEGRPCHMYSVKNLEMTSC